MTPSAWAGGDEKGANQAFLHSFTATAVLSAAGVFFTEPLARLLGADAACFPMVKDDLFWYSLFIIPSGLSVNLQSFCRNDGSPVLAGVATAIGALCSVFLDWLFVFPLQMGLMGAALAMGLSQTVTLLIVLLHFLQKKGVPRFGPFQSSGPLCRKLLFRGLPEMIAQSATPVTTICMNRVLLAYIGGIGMCLGQPSTQ